MLAKKTQTALVTLSVLLASVAPVSAASIQVSDNGADSSNTTNVDITKTVSIFQTNSADVKNSVDVDANTGKNSASENTGGDVSIETGDANAKVVGGTTANSNKTSLNCCGGSDYSVLVSKNGAETENKVNLNINNSLDIVDEKFLNISNRFDVDVNTGKNKTDKNTGGDVRIRTGDANALVVIDNEGNENVIVIGALNGHKPKPEEPKTPGVNPLPTQPSVLGVTKLPTTGFDLPVKLILLASLTMVGLGVGLNKKATSLKSSFKTA